MSFAGIQKSLSDIERKLGKANKIIAKPEMNHKDALKLGAKSNSIVNTIKTSIKQYSSFNPSDSEAKFVLTHMTTVVDHTEIQLHQLVGVKAQLEKLKVGGLVKRNITKTDAVSKELSELMCAKAPEILKADAKKLEQRRAAAFNKALKAFEGASGGEDIPDVEEDDSD